MLRWIRRRLTPTHPLRVAGLDLPTTFAIGRLLGPVHRYLLETEPHTALLVAEARELAGRFDAATVALAAPRWAQLDGNDQDRLAALLIRVALRVRALRPLLVARSDDATYDVVVRDVEAAVHAEHMLRAMEGIYTRTDLPGDTSVRESYMADSMRWHLDRLDPDARVVLVSHANHVQKTPILDDGRLNAYPLGSYLAEWLGPGYRSIVITSTAAEMPEMVYPDDTSEVGFRLAPTRLGEPPAGSVERGLADAGLAELITLTDLAGAPTMTSYRAQSEHQHTAVTATFDAVISVPTATLDPTVAIPSGPS